MPSTVSEAPSISLSFANNFWGKDDAGVNPLLDRMHAAKVTSDELKSFYAARAAIEEEYSKKLLGLARKPLGSAEGGTLRMSLDVVRGEVESIGKSHQNIAAQMKTELDEQLTAFAGGMKERRKIVQGGIEKLLKTKSQQNGAVNKARDRYEQDCLKIKGYLAQGHMVMGQEERKNKAKLEKTQIQLSTSCNEYEATVKVLEETTGRWNRDWKTACDKFQDLEEERIDFMKSSLWSFANIASTVCVSDDASCEKIRLSLEDCDVEKDIATFIKERGTGQEIPDPPKFVNFCREDTNDAASEASNEENYSVAQFQRQINPAYRSSSPQPSAVGPNKGGPSHEAPNGVQFESTSAESTPRRHNPASTAPGQNGAQMGHHHFQISPSTEDLPEVPHNEYPMDGMTQFCRLGPPSSEKSSNVSQNRPMSRGESHSDYSNPTSFSSIEPSTHSSSPTKQMNDSVVQVSAGEDVQKKKGGFFQSRSPFRRKSKNEKDRPPPQQASTAAKRNTWAPSNLSRDNNGGGGARQLPWGQDSRLQHEDRPSASPEPVDPRASFQLNVGNNVFDVASPEPRPMTRKIPTGQMPEELDPMAQALANLKGVSKQSSTRMSADRYHGLATPAPDSGSNRPSGSNYPRPKSSQQLPDRSNNRPVPQPQRRNDPPPPSYGHPQPQPQPASRLGAPQPAHTSKQMQQTTQKYVEKNRNMFSPSSRHNSGGMDGSNAPPPRATSPSPYRTTSPRPGQGNLPRAASPNPYLNGGGDRSGSSGNACPPGPANAGNRPRAQSTSPIKSRQDPHTAANRHTQYGAGAGMPPRGVPRAASPQPQYHMNSGSPNGRAVSRGDGGDMSMQLASPFAGGAYQSRPAPSGYGANARPTSHYGGAPPPEMMPNGRSRSKSTAADNGQQYTRDGRPILHFSRAIYMYTAAIPEELSFVKNDTLAVLRHQDDGWWEAEVVGKRGRGLVPSNYLVEC